MFLFDTLLWWCLLKILWPRLCGLSICTFKRKLLLCYISRSVWLICKSCRISLSCQLALVLLLSLLVPSHVELLTTTSQILWVTIAFRFWFSDLYTLYTTSLLRRSHSSHMWSWHSWSICVSRIRNYHMIMSKTISICSLPNILILRISRSNTKPLLVFTFKKLLILKKLI